MIDKERILSKVDELDTYLNELHQVLPEGLNEYQKVEKKRSSERLLQLCVECTIDICKLFVVGLRLGLPSEENDLFDKLQKKGIISQQMHSVLKEMRGLRNILIHEYAIIDDELVFRVMKTRLGDFGRFKNEILDALERF